MASDTEIAWCAGLFDGEGTTSILKAQRDKYAYIRLSISQKIPEVLRRFQQVVEAGRVYKGHTREIHSLDMYRSHDVINTLNMMWPYLSEVKKNQALNAFERLDNHNYSL